HEVRPDRAEGVRRLPTRPLPIRELQVARTDVVETDVAAHRLERALFRDAAYALSDHDAELGLVVHPFRHARDDDRLARPDQGVRPLRKEERRARQLGALLLRVVAVVEPDADDLARDVDRQRAQDRAPDFAALA